MIFVAYLMQTWMAALQSVPNQSGSRMVHLERNRYRQHYHFCWKSTMASRLAAAVAGAAIGVAAHHFQ
jgi:hypothetical protein